MAVDSELVSLVFYYIYFWVCNKKKAKQALNQKPIYIYYGDNNFIIDEIMWHDQLELE